ncbi:MAG: class I SAM-dependent methyltransferase [Ignavibacteriae bacterium]|nr:class I SAM-dependent methyltransferase [Ignavibacteriota bacterium]
MSKEWYKEWFSNKYYLELYKHRDEKEAIYLINLIQRNINLMNGCKVLDVCCGSGRHSIELAKRGFNVTGFDLSDYLIRQANRQKKGLEERNLKLNFQIKDMRIFNFKKSFDVVINIFSSFGYFENDSENFKVFINVNSSLKKNGYFVFDFLNESYLRKNLVKKDFVIMNGKKIIQERRIENNFVFKDIIIGGKVFTERIKLYPLTTIRKELEESGFRIHKVFGDYYGNKFVKNISKRFVIIAQKN